MMLLIFSDKGSARLEFTLEFIFTQLLHIEFKHTTNFSEFTQYNGPTLNYSNKIHTTAFTIEPVPLLFETTLKAYHPIVFSFQGTKAFFQTTSTDFPFDIFAAAFYLLTRYEEYGAVHTDRHQRFQPAQSIASRNNFLHQAVINRWAEQLRKQLHQRFPQIQSHCNTYSFLPTIDVDNMYAYKGKGFLRTLGASMKSVTKGDLVTFRERIAVMRNQLPDPFDCYAYVHTLIEKYNLELIYFILTSGSTDNDHSLSPTSNAFRHTVKGLKGHNQVEVGIHPSYYSDQPPTKVLDEKKLLEKLLQHPVTKSRQHFLKLQFPSTYQYLIDAGIHDDYSMGYAPVNGFRAGTCNPFYFFNLQTNTKTNLRIHPFVCMDVTYADYKQMQPKEVLADMVQLIDEVKSVKGPFISVWHDRIFDNRRYPGYKQLFSQVLEYNAQ